MTIYVSFEELSELSEKVDKLAPLLDLDLDTLEKLGELYDRVEVLEESLGAERAPEDNAEQSDQSDLEQRVLALEEFSENKNKEQDKAIKEIKTLLKKPYEPKEGKSILLKILDMIR